MPQPSPLESPIAWNLVAAAYAAEIVPMFEAYARDALAARTAIGRAGGDRPGDLTMTALLSLGTAR